MRKLIPVLLILTLFSCAKVEEKKEYYPDGKLMAVKKIQGKKAFTKVYGLDGNLIGEYHYKNDKLHGKTKMYYNDGKIFREIVYKNGDIRKMNQYNEKGEMVIKGN